MLHHVSNHPVHIIDQDGVLYPTALIPFCEFGRSMSVMGVKIDQFDHPVHIKEDDGELYPTALIPFCEFGGNMSVMGVKIDLIDVPVCNSFRPKIIRDQLCYTVDPSKYNDKTDLKQEFSRAVEAESRK